MGGGLEGKRDPEQTAIISSQYSDSMPLPKSAAAFVLRSISRFGLSRYSRFLAARRPAVDGSRGAITPLGARSLTSRLADDVNKGRCVSSVINEAHDETRRNSRIIIGY